MGTVRIGVVGIGAWACDVHIPTFRRLPGAQITALCSRSPENIERGREALGGEAEPAVFASYDALLASDAVDAVVLCTTNVTHGSMTLQALQSGKHVLVEKPMATDPAECPPIVEEAERRGLVVQVGLELRYSDVVRTMRRLIEDGAIGEPAILRTAVWREWGLLTGWRADADRSGGLHHELAVHYIDVFNVLVGRPPEWASAAGGSKLGIRGVDYAFTTIGYEGGAVASFEMCLFAAGGGSDITVEVVGIEGRLVGEIVGGKVELWPRGGEAQDHSPRRDDAEDSGFPGSLESARAFVECVQTGARPSADAVEGARLCRVCEAARLSARQGGERIDVASLHPPGGWEPPGG